MKLRLVFAFLAVSFLAQPAMAGAPSTPGPQNGNNSQPPSGLGRKKDKNPTDQGATAPADPAPNAGRRSQPQQQPPQPPPDDEKKSEDGDDRR